MKTTLLFLFSILALSASAQDSTSVKPHHYAIGVGYGVGNEFKTRDYSYTNRYVQAQLYYSLNPGKKWEYQLALQPELNFATHQLLNLYFVTPDDPNYLEKRAKYTKLTDIHEYILNVSFFARRHLSDTFTVYAMGNVGPMITDTETERLSKGFAFCDVFALGLTARVGGVMLDLRPNVRHISNAGLQSSNAGFNTYNIAFGAIVPL